MWKSDVEDMGYDVNDIERLERLSCGLMMEQKRDTHIDQARTYILGLLAPKALPSHLIVGTITNGIRYKASISNLASAIQFGRNQILMQLLL